MNEPKGAIKNPLTVIAIFAGLAETGGTIVLPFLDPEVQKTYVWFLMSFPILLVILFFGLLTFKHFVLYAPSDFKNEEIFERGLRPAPVNLVEAKLRDEISADELSENEQTSADATDGTKNEPVSEIAKSDEISEKADAPTTISQSITSRRILKATRAEDLAVRRLRAEFDVDLIRNVRSSLAPGFIIDAVGYSGNKTYYFEMKFSSKGVISLTSVSVAVNQLQALYEKLAPSRREYSKFVLVYILDTDEPERVARARAVLRSRQNNSSFPFDFRVYEFEDLLKD